MSSIFTSVDIDGRQRRVQRRLADVGVSAALLTSADNVYYLSGLPLLSEWGRPMWLVVPAQGAPTLIGAEIERENMQEYAKTCSVVTYQDEMNVRFAAVQAAVKALGSAERLGLERTAVTVDVFDSVTEAVGSRETVDVGGLLEAERVVKSPAELELLRTAGQVAKVGADAFLAALSLGTTELSIASSAVAAMDRALGALAPTAASSSYAYCQLGDHSLTPHLHPTGRRLERGELVALNVFPVVWGYCVELERTLVFGEPSEQQAKHLEILDESFQTGKCAYRPRRRFDEVHAEAMSVLSRNGLGDFVRHGTGHAHGIMVGAASREELGEIRSYNTATIEPNMANSIEPGFYLPDLGGFRHSDVLLCGDAGVTCITEFPTQLRL